MSPVKRRFQKQTETKVGGSKRKQLTVISFQVFGSPVPAGSKTIGRTKDGRTFIRGAEKSGPARDWRVALRKAAGEAWPGKLLEGPIALSLNFVLPRPKGHFGARGLRGSAPEFPITRPDGIKLARAVEDALTGILWRDDAQVVDHQIAKRYGEPARLVVLVEER